MSIPASLRKDVCFDIDAAIVFALAVLVGLDFFVVCVIYFFSFIWTVTHVCNKLDYYSSSVLVTDDQKYKLCDVPNVLKFNWKKFSAETRTRYFQHTN